MGLYQKESGSLIRHYIGWRNIFIGLRLQPSVRPDCQAERPPGKLTKLSPDLSALPSKEFGSLISNL